MENDDVFEELEELIGTEAANRLIDNYSGTSIYIPQKIAINRQHQKIKNEFMDGANYRELALRYGYTTKHIRRIIHKKRYENTPIKDHVSNPELDLW